MRKRFLAGLAVLLVTGCTEDVRYSQAVAVLVDVSGTYADQKKDVVDIIKKGILPGLLPGDTIVLIRIDAKSYEKENVEAIVTLDNRPSQANAQKLRFARQLDAFAASDVKSAYTDIQGGMMLAADYLKETRAGTQTIVAFSDMEEDLPKGIRRKLGEKEFDGIRVVATNVKKLNADNADPLAYRERLNQWEERVKESGGREWRVLVDASKLVDYLATRT